MERRPDSEAGESWHLWGDPRKTCMAFGIAVNDGWYNIIDSLCKNIMETDPPATFKALQVKEKWGGLRFYITGETDEIYALISTAEDVSFNVCEDCGTTKNVTTEGGYILTLCKACREKREKQ